MLAPLQSIIVSHNQAPHWDWNPYMAYALRPLRPVVLLGVTGKSTEAPKLQNKYSVCQWWKVRWAVEIISNDSCFNASDLGPCFMILEASMGVMDNLRT